MKHWRQFDEGHGTIYVKQKQFLIINTGLGCISNGLGEGEGKRGCHLFFHPGNKEGPVLVMGQGESVIFTS